MNFRRTESIRPGSPTQWSVTTTTAGECFRSCVHLPSSCAPMSGVIATLGVYLRGTDVCPLSLKARVGNMILIIMSPYLTELSAQQGKDIAIRSILLCLYD